MMPLLSVGNNPAAETVRSLSNRDEPKESIMTPRTVLVFAAAMAIATPALANHCPMDAAAIDAGLAKMTVSDQIKAEVTALKDEGMALHAAGNHAESEAKLAEAMRKLLTAE
jgi:hypothetical protein